MKKTVKSLVMVVMVFGLVCCLGNTSCDDVSGTSAPKSTSGVRKATVKVKTGADGLTSEQRSVAARSQEDNRPGAVKHLYIISAYSGQVIIYSTVKGKVTSSGKRLSPYSVAATDGEYVDSSLMGIPVNIGGRTYRTTEVLQDDGTYGHSIPYLYWWDVQGKFHKHYVSGGQIIHISNQPISVKNIIINMELSGSGSLE